MKMKIQETSDVGYTPKQACDALRARLDEAEAAEVLVAEMREALEPFATAADSYDPPENDDGWAAWAHDFTIGSLRKARTAFSRLEAGERS